MSKNVHLFKPSVERYAELDAEAAIYRERAKFWGKGSIVAQVSKRIHGVHVPVTNDPWHISDDLAMTTLFAY